jgi:MinD superfamily P-loop ATPase
VIQIAVVSGKGGTGKTVITGALTTLLPGRIVMADCDVDAGNLALIVDPDFIATEPFFGMDRARIDPSRCTGCGICSDNCRFHAITGKAEDYQVNAVRCEGCGVCGYLCPSDAISMAPYMGGEMRTADTRYGMLIDGCLYPGSGNSGLMVHQIRRKAREISPETPIILIDGPPGIGCPLLSAVTGCDLVILVTEPGSSGRHDLERLVTVCRSLRSKMMMIINRADLVPEGTFQLRRSAEEWNIPIIGEIPLDPTIMAATRSGRPFTCYESPAADIIRKAGDYLFREMSIHG